MSRKQYVRDRRYGSRNSSGHPHLAVIMKTMLVLTICALLGAGIYGGMNYSSIRTITAEYDKFLASCDSMDYSSAVAIYRDTQEKTLSTSVFMLHQKERKESLLKMEEKVNTLIEVPFNNLIVNRTAFSDKDLFLINGFQELSTRKISDLATRYLEDFLLGKYDKESVVWTFSELKNIAILENIAVKCESGIDGIDAFSAEMIAIDNEYREKNYLDVAAKVKAAIEIQTGFVKDYLNRFYENCKNEMYPILKGDIDVMMSGSKYYTAKALIDQLLIFFPEDTYLAEQQSICKANVTTDLVEYQKPVEHLSIRPLIATPSLAFDQDNYAKNAEDLMITAEEFRKILAQLYEKNYILVDINTLVTSTGERNRLYYPEGKIPLILSIEGLNYYAGRSRSGNSENLSLDSNGNVVSTYKLENGETVTDRNGEAIGILEQFIEEHPDFSFDGSKGTISLTGFECIFGYVTNEDQVDDRTEAYVENNLQAFSITPGEIKSNREKVLEIIAKLKRNGWTFSCSTYGNILVADATLQQLQSDTEKWLDQVGSLTGEVKVLLFPSGSFVGSKDERGAYLIEKGFTIHAGIGPWAYFNFSGKNLYMDRIALNGLALRYQDLSRFFDVRAVYDPARTNILK